MQELMEHFYRQNAGVSNIRILGGTANISMRSPQVDISKLEIEDEYGEEDEGKEIDDVEMELKKGGWIPLPWELLQLTLRILGHYLLAPLNPQEVKYVALVAVRSLYARASHNLVRQVILATRSLIQLCNSASEAAKAANAAAEAATAMSNVSTPSKSKKPKILLVSK